MQTGASLPASETTEFASSLKLFLYSNWQILRKEERCLVVTNTFTIYFLNSLHSAYFLGILQCIHLSSIHLVLTEGTQA